MSFLRPQTIAGAAVYRVCIPDTAEWRTQLWGAISLLLQDWQWEGDSSLSDDEIAAEFLAVLNSFERDIMSAGMVMAFAGPGPFPTGWVRADGTLLAKSAFPELYAVIGNIYGGSGDFFKLPDIKQRHIKGAINPAGVGTTGGSSVGTLTEAQIPAHSHEVHTHLTSLAVAPGEMVVSIPTITPGQTGDTGGGQSHNNDPLFFVQNWIICLGQC